MAAANIGDIAELRLEYTVNGQKCFNVLHYKVVITNLAEDNQTVMSEIIGIEGSAVAGTLCQSFRSAFGSNVVVNNLYGQWVYPVRYRSLVDPIGLQGLVAEECTAQNLQATILKKGPLANRHNMGAVRVGGVPTLHYSEGMLTEQGELAYDALMATLTETIGNTAGDVTLTPTILNKVNTGTEEDPDYEITGGTNILVWQRKDEVRTQRTRTVGRGI